MSMRRGASGIAAAAALAVALSGCSAAATAPLASARPKASRAVVSVVAIGDSITAGLGVDPAQAWPELVAEREHWRLTDLGVSGAGFVTLGDDGHTYDAQVAEAIGLRPDVLLVSASDNDLDADAATLSDAATSLLARLRAALPGTTIVGVNALSGAAADPDLKQDDALIRRAVTGVDGHWMDLGQPFRGRPGLVQGDGEHPTADGQRAIADLVVSLVKTLPVPTSVAEGGPEL